MNIGLSIGVGGGEIPVTGAIELGVGFGWAKSWSKSTTQGQEFGEGKCGWWYEATVMVHSCGSLTEYEHILVPVGRGPPLGKSVPFRL
jgi:hypothetical protein